MKNAYPDTFVCPSQQGYSVDHDFRTASVKMQGGYTVTRRREPHIFRNLSLSFTMSVAEFADWWAWAHQAGFRWFSMNLDTQYTVLRFIGNVQFVYGDYNTVTATVPAEQRLYYDDPEYGPIVPPVDNPVEGGGPSAPGSTIPPSAGADIALGAFGSGTIPIDGGLIQYPLNKVHVTSFSFIPPSTGVTFYFLPQGASIGGTLEVWLSTTAGGPRMSNPRTYATLNGASRDSSMRFMNTNSPTAASDPFSANMNTTYYLNVLLTNHQYPTLPVIVKYNGVGGIQ